MNFPTWDVRIGLPILVAAVAIAHVVVAHFAIGGGLFLVVYEGRARARGDAAMLAFVRRHSRFFVLLTLVFGAITGVGIWFTIGLVHPAGTSALIRTFVWFWATEWAMFLIEIASALVYFHGWDRLPPRTHLAVGWVYFVAAWLSLAVINGIVTFMLTPGGWIEDRDVWAGFFNRSYLPSLATRTLFAFLLAGLFAVFTGSALANPDLKRRVLRIASSWSLPSLALLAPSLVWYRSALPPEIGARLAGGWTALENATSGIAIAGGLLALGLLLHPLGRPRRTSRFEAGLLLVLGVALFGSFEWYRESARKPFVIAGYLYANGLRVGEEERFRQEGLAPHLKWRRDDPAGLGEDLYRTTCASCHSLRGYNGLARSVAAMGWTEGELASLVPLVGHMRGAMPPFPGTAEEARHIARYLVSEAAKTEPPPAPADRGERAWRRNCDLCHGIDRFRGLRDSLEGLSVEEIGEIVVLSGEFPEKMPPFLGDGGDVEALARYLERRLAGTRGTAER